MTNETMLDLQLFGEETEQETQTTPPEEPAAEAPAPEPEKEEIPPELDGLPEEVAREAMEEARQEQPKPAESENSDNKPSEGDPVNKAIPYPRFKEQVDKSNALEEQLAAYRAKYGELGSNNAPVQPQPAPTANPQPQQAPPAIGQQPQPAYSGMRITPEISAKIEEAVNQQALQITGMTAEDVESLEEYGDDDNPKLKTLENARAMARSYIMGEITEAIRQQQAQQAAALRQQQSMVDDYNAFAQKEFAEPDFQAVRQYATTDYFSALTQGEQDVLRNAYARIEGHLATPSDFVLVKRFFSDAKNAFHAQSGTKQTPAPKPQQTKPNLPRASEVDGSAAAPSQGLTAETLAKMLDEVDDPSQLPENVQKLLMG